MGGQHLQTTYVRIQEKDTSVHVPYISGFQLTKKKKSSQASLLKSVKLYQDGCENQQI